MLLKLFTSVFISSIVILFIGGLTAEVSRIVVYKTEIKPLEKISFKDIKNFRPSDKFVKIEGKVFSLFQVDINITDNSNFATFRSIDQSKSTYFDLFHFKRVPVYLAKRHTEKYMTSVSFSDQNRSQYIFEL